MVSGITIEEIESISGSVIFYEPALIRHNLIYCVSTLTLIETSQKYITIVSLFF